MDFKELKKKSESDLHKVLADYRAKLRELRFKDANKQLKNVREIRAIRTVIAQVLTLLSATRKAQIKEIAKKTSEKVVAKEKVKKEDDKK